MIKLGPLNFYKYRYQNNADIIYFDIDNKNRIKEVGLVVENKEFQQELVDILEKMIKKEFSEIKNLLIQNKLTLNTQYLLYQIWKDWEHDDAPFSQQKGQPIESLICRCFGVYEQEIIDFLNKNPYGDAFSITEVLKAGGGCTKCKKELYALVSDFRVKNKIVSYKKRQRVNEKTPVEIIQGAQQIIDSYGEKKSPVAEIISYDDYNLKLMALTEDENLNRKISQELEEMFFISVFLSYKS